ncbi:hypothetical protein HYX04_05585 [Candidatus Woesearchaeota archaeon]|nr:hypothetical protein [Candidatus Woesearchaeota archaeon]
MTDAQIIKMLTKGQNDLKWFDLHLNELINEYNEKFIAFQEDNVIEFDSDLNKLMKKLENKNIDTSNLIIKFVSKIKFIL